MPELKNFTREELEEIRLKALELAENTNELWCRAYMCLADAVDHLDAMKARSELIEKEGVVERVDDMIKCKGCRVVANSAVCSVCREGSHFTPLLDKEKPQPEDVRTMIKTVEHYVRMIIWVEKQPKGNLVNGSKMREEIDESWDSRHCNYCKRYLLQDDDCSRCSLNPNIGVRYCCNGLWVEMNLVKTWGDWIEKARKVLEYIIKNG